MENNLKDLYGSISSLCVLFVAIVLQDASAGTLSKVWLTLMGVITIGLSLSAMLLRLKKRDDVFDNG